jgi:hypothetical protein
MVGVGGTDVSGSRRSCGWERGWWMENGCPSDSRAGLVVIQALWRTFLMCLMCVRSSQAAPTDSLGRRCRVNIMVRASI